MNRTRSLRTLLGLLAATCPLGLVLLDGCGGERCNEGYHLERHLCYQDAPAGAGMAGTGEAGAPACQEQTLGSACMAVSECGCDTDFCAAQPKTVGFCTRSGCDEDPSLCPDGYSCMDLSGIVAGLPAICVPAS